VKKNESQLVEIGPRFVLIPIRIFNGSLGGPTLYQNPSYVSPNQERSDYKKRKGDRYVQRTGHSQKRQAFLSEHVMPVDELASINVFK
jgi:ribosome biogenesis protein BRX1